MNLFSNTNLKQFEFIKYVAENAGDEHVMAKIIIRLRYDKVEAPYYMETRIRISSCADLQDNGIFHAMDVFNLKTNMVKFWLFLMRLSKKNLNALK